MSQHHDIVLKAADGSYVEAVLHERIDEQYALKVDYSWKTHLHAEEARAADEGRAVPNLEHGHWEWGEKVRHSAQLLSCPTLAIECAGDAQGLMLLQTDGHFGLLSGEAGKPLVYIVFLATAPWNLRAVASTPRYSGVGVVMLHAAIALSLENEFQGRIGLHSLPQAEGFYEAHGFQCLGEDPEKGGLKYYELSPRAAQEFIDGSTTS